MSQRTIRLVIIGKVQGVGFRAWVEDGARERQLRGWVRNRRDGSVAAVFHVEVTDYTGEVPARFKVLPTE